MKTDIAFWDTSAIVPLCCVQDASFAARREKRRFKFAVVWWGTVVEIHSGIARLKRLGQIDDRGISRATLKWERFQEGANIVQPVASILSIGKTLPDTYGLRSQDAFQLAAALEWCGERPRNRPFITADRRLGEAASDAGFNAITLS